MINARRDLLRSGPTSAALTRLARLRAQIPEFRFLLTPAYQGLDTARDVDIAAVQELRDTLEHAAVGEPSTRVRPILGRLRSGTRDDARDRPVSDRSDRSP